MDSGEILTAGGRELQVIATPGHTQGHVVFYDAASKLMFAGDHVLPNITPSIGFEPIRSPNALQNYLNSLSNLLQIDDCTLLPAHGDPGGSMHARVRELVAHHDVRLNEMSSVLNDAPQTAFDVAQQVSWTSKHRSYDELNLFNQILAILETDSHLRLLGAMESVRVTQIHGVDNYAKYSLDNS